MGVAIIEASSRRDILCIFKIVIPPPPPNYDLGCNAAQKKNLIVGGWYNFKLTQKNTKVVN